MGKLNYTSGEYYNGYFKNGISLRNDRYRLTKFYRKEKSRLELYDHKTDPEENHNIAEYNKELIKSLMQSV